MAESGCFRGFVAKNKSGHSRRLRDTPTINMRSGPARAILGVFGPVADFLDFADWRAGRVHESGPRMHVVFFIAKYKN